MMAIENIQQLKNYIDRLPWYKRFFFPRRLSAVLNNPLFETENDTVIVTCLSALFMQIRTSILWRFYNWLFPDLGGLGRFCKKKLGAHPSEIALIEAVHGQKLEQIKHLINLPFDDRPNSMALITALIVSAKYRYYSVLSTLLQQEQVYDTMILNGAFDAAAKDKEWEIMGVFAQLHAYSKFSIYQRLDVPTCNKLILLTACAYKTSELTELLQQKHIAPKISLATMSQVLLHLVGPSEHTQYFDISVFKSLLNFKDVHHERLSIDFIQTVYIVAIKQGRLEAIKVLQTMQGFQPPPMESIIQAVQAAAQYRHYEMVLHLIPMIPSDKRLKVLQTKALERKSIHYLNVPEKTHILQWAVSRCVPQDIQTILDALNAQEKYILITHCDSTLRITDISPLSLTTANGWTSNLIILLNALSSEQLMEALLPNRVSLLTPLRRCDKNSLPIFLEKIFGKNKKLHDAYHFLSTEKSDRKSLENMRDYYLATHFPSSIQKSLTFFKPSFSIPGYPLSNEELDKVVRVAFYQRYGEFDSVQREKIETRIRKEAAAEHVNQKNLLIEFMS